MKPVLKLLGIAGLSGGASFLLPAYFLAAAPAQEASPAKPIAAPALSDIQFNPFKPGEADFVISNIAWALGPDADKSDACGSGMTELASDIYQKSPDGKRHDGEKDDDYARRIRTATAPAPGVPNACQFPVERGPDPNYRTVTARDVAVFGVDLDGQDSRAKGRPARGTCAHDDFQGIDGGHGIDNQFYRAVGCTRGFQSTGSKIPFATEMLTGSWGILVTVKGIDSLTRDDDVEVGIYANADPIQLSAARKPLSHATYAIDPDPRFQARTHGRIVNGVLTTDPVTVRFHSVTNSMMIERPMEDARLRMTFARDGSMEGLLAGYTDVDELFDYLVAYRKALDMKGKPAATRRIIQTADGSSASAGLTCNGLYHAFRQLADGHRDPKTGQCSALSTQYRVWAIPAFVAEKPGKAVAAAGPVPTGAM